jgi:hypothetical protein
MRIQPRTTDISYYTDHALFMNGGWLVGNSLFYVGKVGISWGQMWISRTFTLKKLWVKYFSHISYFGQTKKPPITRGLLN